jgi:bacterioferritin-associated ferredoxin
MSCLVPLSWEKRKRRKHRSHRRRRPAEISLDANSGIDYDPVLKRQFNIILGSAGMYICLCKGITDSQVRNVLREGVVCAEALAARLGIDRDDCCGRCLSGISDLLSLAPAGCANARLTTVSAATPS